MFRQSNYKLFRDHAVSLPELTSFNIDDKMFSYEPSRGNMELNEGNFSVDYKTFKWRSNGSNLDARFRLCASHNFKVEKELTVGRNWSPYYEGTFSFAGYDDPDGKEVELQPAYAGVTGDMLDRNAVTALGSLGRAFGSIKSEDINERSRIALRSLSALKISATRLMVRGAALYLSALAADADGKPLNVTNANVPPMYRMDSPGEFNRMLNTAITGSRMPLYVETRDNFAFQQDYLPVYSLICSQQVSFEDDSPTVSGFWPTVPEMSIYVMGELVAIKDVSTASFDHSTIYDAMEALARQMGLMELWAECLELVTSFLVRPQGQEGILPGIKTLDVPLPYLDTRACALGPMLLSTRSWLTSTSTTRTKPYHYWAWRGWSYHGIHALTLRHAAFVAGADTMVSNSVSSEEYSSHRDLVLRQQLGTPLVLAAAKIAAEVGQGLAFGKHLINMSWNARTKFDNGNSSGVAPLMFCKNPVQWEEYLGFVTHIPYQAAAMALLRPAYPTHSPPAGVLFHSGYIASRRGEAHGMYSAVMGGSDASLTHSARGYVGTSSARYIPRKSYRDGGLDDYQFEAFSTSAADMRYAFYFSATDTAYSWYMETNRLRNLEWKIFKPYLLSEDGLLNAAANYPGELPGFTNASIVKMSEAKEVDGESKSANIESKSAQLNPETKSTKTISRVKTRKEKIGSTVAKIKNYLFDLTDGLEAAQVLAEGRPDGMGLQEWSEVVYQKGRAMTLDFQNMPPAALLQMVELNGRSEVASAMADIVASAAVELNTASGRVDVAKYAVGLQNIAAGLATNPYLTASELRDNTRLALDPALDEHFTLLLSSGRPLEELSDLVGLSPNEIESRLEAEITKLSKDRFPYDEGPQPGESGPGTGLAGGGTEDSTDFKAYKVSFTRETGMRPLATRGEYNAARNELKRLRKVLDHSSSIKIEGEQEIQDKAVALSRAVALYKKEHVEPSTSDFGGGRSSSTQVPSDPPVSSVTLEDFAARLQEKKKNAILKSIPDTTHWDSESEGGQEEEKEMEEASANPRLVTREEPAPQPVIPAGPTTGPISEMLMKAPEDVDA